MERTEQLGPEQARKLAADQDRQRNLVKDLIEEYNWRESSQEPWKRQREQWWRRWHSDPSLVMPDRNNPNWQSAASDPASASRPKLKDWQHYILNPHGFVNERAQTEAMTNLIVEASPIFKARGFQDDDIPTETPLESLDNYMYAVLNPANEWIGECFIRGYIQGIAPLKQRYLNKSSKVNLLPRYWEVKRFEQALKAARDFVNDAQAKGDKEAQDVPGVRPDGTIDPMMDVEAFQRWAGLMGERYGIQVPMPPVGRQHVASIYQGLKVDHIELSDIVWDPKIPTMREQRRIFQRLVVDKGEFLRHAKAENERARSERRQEPYNLPAIETLDTGIAFRGSSHSASELQERIMQIYGITSGGPSNDPAMKNAIEVIEAWAPGEGDTGTWCQIGQRDRALTNYGCFPFSFRVHPYSVFVNIPTPGQLVGKSNYDIHAPSHDHLDVMRGYIADYYALMAGQPMYGSGMEDGRKLEIKPFEVFEVVPGEEYKQLFNFSSQLDGALNYAQLLKGEIDQGMGIDDVTRGQSAQINRVGVGEVQLRAQNQQNRMRGLMYRLSTMCSRDLIPFGNMLIWQFGDPTHIENVSGGMPFEPEEMLASENLIPGTLANHMVMPQAMMVEAALALQQLQETIKIGREMGVLVTGGKAAVAVLSRLMSMGRMRGIEQVIELATKDIEEAKQVGQQQQAVQDAQAQLKLVQQQNDGLRAKLQIPPAAELDAEIKSLTAPPPPEPGADGQQPPPPQGPPQEGMPQ